MARTRNQAADAKRKADENKARVDEITARNAQAAPSPLPSKMTRPELVAYLQAAGVYAGHSRDSKDQLVALAQQVRYADDGTATATKVAEQAKGTPAGDAAERELAADLYSEVAGMPTDNPTATADANPVRRHQLAKTEWEALRAWANAGRTPPRPATPNLDQLEAEHRAPAAGQPRKRSTTPKATTRTRVEVGTLPAGATEGTCTGPCGATLPAAKFPKAVVNGKRQADQRASECRACRDARRGAKGSAAEAAA